MATEKSPDAGWNREPKERSNGRMDWSCLNQVEDAQEIIRSESETLVMQMEDLPKWLPSGWSMVTKTRKSGTKAGKQYKCYISSTGCKFYSKGEVFRYLKNAKRRSHTTELNKRDAAAHSTKSGSEGVVEKHTVDGLPPGWIKEIKVTQVADRTRKDPYYIDPVTGYEFRSRKDVFRYLESGDIGKCAIRPKKRQISGMEPIDGEISSPTAGKKHKIAGNATRRSLFTRQSSRFSKAVEDKLVLESSVVEECVPLSMDAQDVETSRMISEAHQESEGIKNVEGKMVCAENGFISATGAEVYQEKQPLEKLHSADRESSKLISAAQESGGLENTEKKIICAEKGLISSEADVFAEKQPSVKPHDADGESFGLVGEALEFGGLENVEEKICAEEGLISVPAADVYLKKQPSVKLHDADGKISEMISAAQESGCLENAEEKVVCAEGLISAPATQVSPVKQLSEKLHYEDGESSEPISAAQESGGLENTGGKTICAEGLISAHAIEVSPEKQPSKQPHSVDGKSSEAVSIAQQESEVLENKEHTIVHAENGLISALLAKVSPGKQPSEKSIGKRKNRAQLCTNNKNGKELLLCRRASKRLAGLEAEFAPDLGMSERALQMVARRSVNREANPTTGVNPSSCNHQASEEMEPPEAAAEVVVGTLHTPRSSGVLFDENTSMEGERRMEDQTAPGKLSRKLETENQSTEKPESPIVLPFGDSWPDPCLEFAFKTLTGAIPVDDSLVIGDYFQQNLRMDHDKSISGITLPDLGLDGFCQTDILFQFGGTEKSAAKQQSPGKPAFTSLGNCGMAASGDSASQQHNVEGGKECGRKVNN